jgi:hypothetical protein
VQLAHLTGVQQLQKHIIVLFIWQSEKKMMQEWADYLDSLKIRD